MFRVVSLKSFSREFRQFKNLTSLTKFLESNRDEEILLIVGDALPKKSLSKLNSYQHIRKVFPSAKNLDEAVKKEIDDYQRELFPFSIFDQNQRTSQDVSNESNRFLWYQVLFYVLRQMPNDDVAKEDMLKLYSKFYQNDSKKKELIEEYRKTSSNVDQSIIWYTRDTFFYRLANQALRSEDLFLVYHLRYWINNLALAIELKDKKPDDLWTLFSGFRMHKDEFERLKMNVNQIISINSFLSTSRSKQVAQIFAGSGPIEDPLVRILLQIQANPSRLRSVFVADIQSISQFESEEEVLFSLGSTFRLVSIDFDDENQISIIQLEATDETFERIRSYCQLADANLQTISTKIYFGTILNENLGQTDRAIKYFRELIRFLGEHHQDLPDLYQALGDAHVRKNEMNRAVESYKIQMKMTKNQRKFEKILKDKLIDEEKKINGDHLTKAFLLEQLAEYSNSAEAEIYLIRALKIYEHFNLANPQMSHCLDELAWKYRQNHKYRLAIDLRFRRFEIEEKYLPMENEKLCETLRDIKIELESPDDFQRFIDLCHEKLPILTSKLGEEHRRVIRMENDLDEIEEKLENFQIELEKWQKKENEIDSDDLERTYRDLSRFYFRYGFYEKSLNFSLEQLKITENPTDRFQIYDVIVQCYERLLNLPLAFSYRLEAYRYAESLEGSDSKLARDHRERVDNLFHFAARRDVILPWIPSTPDDDSIPW